MTPKAKHADLVAVKVLREQRWAYEQRLEHMSYYDMRRRAGQPVELGGLGYDVSEHRLKGLVSGYLERMAEVEAVNLDEHRARELHDLDRSQRRLDGLAQLAAKALGKADELEVLDVHAAKLLLDAEARHRAVGESRRKLLGIDAPQQVKAEVTVRDAVTDELNEMLARAGRKPIEVE